MVILHIIVGLKVGGAELMLKRLIEFSQNDSQFKHIVISMTCLGEVGLAIKSTGVEVRELGMKSMFDTPRAFLRLVRLIRHIKPDVVQTWMYHADLLGGIAGRIAGINNVIWNVRNTEIPQRRISGTSLVIKMCAALSRIIPKKIICCAQAGLSSHVKLGYDAKRMIVIPNGFDTRTWSIPSEPRNTIRATYALPQDKFIVGIVGRFDPLKGYNVFVKAAALMAERCTGSVLFLMVGRNVDTKNPVLKNFIETYGGRAEFKLIGESKEISKLMYAMDVYCLASLAEGFPNVVAEAMLMQTPCVVTDVGDAKQIIGSLGIVVRAGEALELADALLKMECLGVDELKALGHECRERIVRLYDIEKIAHKYLHQYEDRTN